VTIVCPGCTTPYVLPHQLLGPAGARVCCPACWLTFVLGPAGDVTAVIGHASAAPAPSITAAVADSTPHGEPAATPPAGGSNGDGPDADVRAEMEARAGASLRELDDPPGSLAAAAAAGRLFAEHGPALLDAFEALAHEHPAEAAALFRAALFDRTGLDLSSSED